MRERKGLNFFEKVKGHAGIEGNEKADELANRGASKADQDKIPCEIPAGYNATGAKLATITQALAYKGIIESLNSPERKGMVTNLDKTRWTAKDRTGDIPTDKVIWRSLKNKCLTWETRIFLWKALHNAYKVGRYWENIKNMNKEQPARPAERRNP